MGPDANEVDLLFGRIREDFPIGLTFAHGVSDLRP